VHLNLGKPELSLVYLMFIFKYLMFIFRYLEWGSELYREVMQASCYPFNMPGRQPHNMNVQVCWATVFPYLSHTYPWFMLCLQNVVLTVPPYPFVLEDPSAVYFEE
jgi:hypothetical protein